MHYVFSIRVLIDYPPTCPLTVDHANATRRRGSGPNREEAVQREARPLLRCMRLNVWENGRWLPQRYLSDTPLSVSPWQNIRTHPVKATE